MCVCVFMCIATCVCVCAYQPLYIGQSPLITNICMHMHAAVCGIR